MEFTLSIADIALLATLAGAFFAVKYSSRQNAKDIDSLRSQAKEEIESIKAQSKDEFEEIKSDYKERITIAQNRISNFKKEHSQKHDSLSQSMLELKQEMHDLALKHESYKSEIIKAINDARA